MTSFSGKGAGCRKTLDQHLSFLFFHRGYNTLTDFVSSTSLCYNILQQILLNYARIRDCSTAHFSAKGQILSIRENMGQTKPVIQHNLCSERGEIDTVVLLHLTAQN